MNFGQKGQEANVLDRLKGIQLLAGIFVLFVAATGTASAQDLFTVTGVHVDESADTAAQARDQALAKGQRDAFLRVIDRLTLPENRGNLEMPDQSTITNMVRDFGVSNEKTSSVRYIADMTVRFKDDRIRSFLRFQNIPFAETQSKPVLVLPVYTADGYTRLWDDPNPWRDVWAKAVSNGGLVPVKAPIGDLEDIGTITAQQAQNGAQDALAKISQRYGADVVIIADAQVSGDPGAQTVDVTVTRYAKDGSPQVFGVRQSTASGEELDQTLTHAVDDVRSRIEDDWKRANMIDYGNRGQLTVFVPVTGLKDWANIETSLSAMPIVRQAHVVAMSRREVQLDLDYLGSPQQLRTALAQRNLSLQQVDNLWFIQPAGENRLQDMMGQGQQDPSPQGPQSQEQPGQGFQGQGQ